MLGALIALVALGAPGVRVHANLDSITALAVDARGTIWAGTPGGVLSWSGDAPPRHWTRANGLPGLRVSRLALFAPGSRSEAPLAVSASASLLQAGRFVPYDGAWPKAPTPDDGDTGLAARCLGAARWGAQWVFAVPDAGLWVVRGGKPAPLSPPAPSVQATAVAARGADLYLGTAGQGVWRLRQGQWKALPPPANRLPGLDAVALLSLGDTAWIAPREGAAFQLSGAAAPKGGSPWRQAVLWRGRWLVRRADGRVIGADAPGAESPSGLALPRATATALAVHGDALFVAQPGGFSEFRAGFAPVHRFDVPPLEGRPTTCLCVDGAQIAVGTQNNGLVLIDRATGAARHLHEAHGLTDDWITAVAPDDQGGLLVGTFVGGLMRWDGQRFALAGPKGACVTRLLPDGPRVWVGTLQGVFLWESGRLTRPEWADSIEPDVTDLARVGDELWIASGGALHRVPAPD